jgi:hypothetical protein
MPSLTAASAQPAETHFPSTNAGSPDLLMEVLFEWRVAQEDQLRLITTVQRYLQKVRSPSTSDGERSLLVAEIQRLLANGTPDPPPFRQRAHTLAESLAP